MPDPWTHPQGKSKCPSLAKLWVLLDLSALLPHMLQQTKCLCSPKAILPQAVLPVDISSFVWIKGCHHSFTMRIWFSPVSSHSWLSLHKYLLLQHIVRVFKCLTSVGQILPWHESASVLLLMLEELWGVRKVWSVPSLISVQAFSENNETWECQPLYGITPKSRTNNKNS